MAKPAKRKRQHHGQLWRRIIKAEHAAVVVLMAAGLALATALTGAYYQTWHPDAAGAPVEASARADYYQSLDLSQARQAIYSNTAITRVKDLSQVGSADRAVVKFAVPKDGLTEYGLMTLPVAPAPSGGWPVIILCHGYANPRTYSTTTAYLSDMLFYSRHGFAVIKPDLRGQGLSLADGSPEGAYYSMAYNTDIMSLIAAVKATPYLNKDHINIWGHSMGGYLALRATVLSPDIKTAIILSGPVGTPAHMYGDYQASSDMNNPDALDIRDQKLARYGTPLSNPAFWGRVSPLNYLAGTKAYIQIHVGTADKVVPPLFSADLDHALNKINKVHGYFVYKGATHGLVGQRGAIWDRSLTVLSH